ncbi:MAG: NAD-dependent epimerase/dehydratase family protein, partial [Thermoanaerobaculales bacterium]|nr:NAD-dependent epimerase/dehydratase family protein [Thermoanaerobaculales bacterium]
MADVVPSSMKIVVSGASGLVGSDLVRALERDGHRVLRLVRRAPQGGSSEAAWDPSRGSLDPAVLSGAGAVINLNGRSIAA